MFQRITNLSKNETVLLYGDLTLLCGVGLVSVQPLKETFLSMGLHYPDGFYQFFEYLFLFLAILIGLMFLISVVEAVRAKAAPPPIQVDVLARAVSQNEPMSRFYDLSLINSGDTLNDCLVKVLRIGDEKFSHPKVLPTVGQIAGGRGGSFTLRKDEPKAAPFIMRPVMYKLPTRTPLKIIFENNEKREVYLDTPVIIEIGIFSSAPPTKAKFQASLDAENVMHMKRIA